MLSLAVLVPDTPLLVPGAAGRAHVLDAERAAAGLAARSLVRIAPDRVVVVASARVARVLEGHVRASLAAAGIADAELGWAARSVPTGAPSALDVGGVAPTASAAATVALLLLASAGWTGPVTVVEVAPPAIVGGDELRALGRSLAAGADRVAFVVAGSLSARNGPGALLAEDDRAAGVDAALLASLDGLAAPAAPAAPGAPAVPAVPAAPADLAPTSALDPLAPSTGALAAELAVTAWAPLQVLLGAVGEAAPGASGADVPLVTRPFGVTYVVTTWGFGLVPPVGAIVGARRAAAS